MHTKVLFSSNSLLLEDISPHTPTLSSLSTHNRNDTKPTNSTSTETSTSESLFDAESSAFLDLSCDSYSTLHDNLNEQLDSAEAWSPQFTDELLVTESFKSQDLFEPASVPVLSTAFLSLQNEPKFTKSENLKPALLSSISPISITHKSLPKQALSCVLSLSSLSNNKRRLSTSSFASEIAAQSSYFAPTSQPSLDQLPLTPSPWGSPFGHTPDIFLTSGSPPDAKRLCNGTHSTPGAESRDSQDTKRPTSGKFAIKQEETANELIQTATPPPSTHKGRRKAFEQSPSLGQVKTMQDDQTFGQADFMDNVQPDLSAFLQSGTDMYGYPMSAPVGAGPNFWDTGLSLSSMDIDFLADDIQLFAQQPVLPTQGQLPTQQVPSQHQQEQHNQFMQFQQQQNQQQPMQLSTGFLGSNTSVDSNPMAGLEWDPQDSHMFNSHAVATAASLSLPLPAGSPQQLQRSRQAQNGQKRERPIASKPPRIDTSGIANIDGLSPAAFSPLSASSYGMPLHSPAVNPGLLYAQPPPPNLTLTGYGPPTLRSSVPSPCFSPAEPPVLSGNGTVDGSCSLSRSSSLKENKAVTKARPGLHRSLSDARAKRNVGRPNALPSLAPVSRPQSPGLSGSGVNAPRPIAQPRSISARAASPAKSQRFAQLASIPESHLNIPRSRPASPSVKFVIDASGKAHAEALPASAPRRLASRELDRRSRSYSPADHDGSSSDEEPIIIPGRSTPVVLPDPKKPVGSIFSHPMKRSPSERSSSTHGTATLPDLDRNSPAVDGDMERSHSKSDRTRPAANDGDAMSELLRLRESRRRRSNEKMAAAASSALSSSMKNLSGLASGVASVANSPPASAVQTPVMKSNTLTFNVKASVANANSAAGGGISLLTAGLQMQQSANGNIEGTHTTVLADRSVSKAVAPMENTIRCICHKNSPEGLSAKAVMLNCNSCKYWLHGKCLKITNKAKPPVYICAFCSGIPVPTPSTPAYLATQKAQASVKAAAKAAAKESPSPLMAPKGFQETSQQLLQQRQQQLHQLSQPPMTATLMAPSQQSAQ